MLEILLLPFHLLGALMVLLVAVILFPIRLLLGLSLGLLGLVGGLFIVGGIFAALLIAGIAPIGILVLIAIGLLLVCKP